MLENLSAETGQRLRGQPPLELQAEPCSATSKACVCDISFLFVRLAVLCAMAGDWFIGGASDALWGSEVRDEGGILSTEETGKDSCLCHNRSSGEMALEFLRGCLVFQL